MIYKIKMEDGECFFGGTAVDGEISPFDKTTDIERDFNITCENQTMPMYLSTCGRSIWSDEPFKVTVKNGEFIIDGNDVILEKHGDTLKDAFLGAMKKHFPPSGEKLPEEFFSIPQYNTWMQFTYNPSEEKVLKFAKDIIDNGFKPGILIIDEGWQKEYGVWEFDQLKFPDPKGMIEKLHKMGFIVMLWVVPYVRPDGEAFIRKTLDIFNPEEYDKLFLRNEKGEIALSYWWNGYSATFDLTKECDCNLFDAQLKKLMKDYGVDGYKFDGGTVEYYSDSSCVNGPVNKDFNAYERNIAWNEFGSKYKYHEYKDTFKGGGKRVIQRIRDRGHLWEGDGLSTLMPMAILQGLLGHPFICPDMIGGGEWTYRDLNIPVDKELFVRMAQCSALFPMMQFSWAPWEALDKEHLELVREAHDLHIKFKDIFLSLVNDAYKTGEPILRNLEYNYPHLGYEKINDQFMLGENILVAPVIKKGQKIRTVILPSGEWESYKGEIFEGGKTVEIPVTLKDIPYFIKKQ